MYLFVISAIIVMTKTEKVKGYFLLSGFLIGFIENSEASEEDSSGGGPSTSAIIAAPFHFYFSMYSKAVFTAPLFP